MKKFATPSPLPPPLFLLFPPPPPSLSVACVIPVAVALPTLIAGIEGTVKKPFKKENFLNTFWNSLNVFCKVFFKKL